MTENKRFTIIQDGDNFTVRDTLKNRPMGMFEFKEDEFSVYFCFHKIIDLLNELHDENKQLKKENKEIKQLIHTMLVQIDTDKINTENTRYSARIVFTFEEFKKIQQIWKGDCE